MCSDIYLGTNLVFICSDDYEINIREILKRLKLDKKKYDTDR